MRCIMAGTFSHFKFMEDLSVNLGFDKPKELFLIAGQGHDLLFFIKLRNFKKFGKQSAMAKIIAKDNFAKLVKCWQEEILKTDNEELEYLLYGYIAHHVLDSHIHPWINSMFYFDKNDMTTWQNNGKHEMLESIIDVIVMNPYKYSIPKVKIGKDSIDSLNRIFEKIYNITNMGDLFSEGISNMKGFIRIYRKDKLGIKKIAYKIIDTFSCADQQKFGFLALKYKEKEKMKVREEYLKEFNKLYNLALKDCMALLEQIHDNLSQKKIADIAFDKPAI